MEYALLEPIAADRPCGENLEDTPLLASFDAFRLFGESTPPEQRPDPSDREGKKVLPPPEWGNIKGQALEALKKSKDLRLLAHLGVASLRTDGLPAFAETLEIAAEWLSQYWNETYPQVDEDALLRRNALNCFADPMAVIDGLRRYPLVSSRGHGRFSLRDIEIASGQQTPGEGEAPAQEASITAAFAEMAEDALSGLRKAVGGAGEALKRINDAMSAAGGTEAMPEFGPLTSVFDRMGRALDAQIALRNPAGAEGSAEAGADGGAAVGGAVAVGAIKSRQDAIRALDAVAEFFRRNEPSSPIPLFAERAKRLVAKDFLEVLADIAPDAVATARSAGGLGSAPTE